MLVVLLDQKWVKFLTTADKYLSSHGHQSPGFPCIGNRICKGSQMSVLTSGCGGKNCGTEIRTVKKQKTQGKNGVNVSQNLVK